MNVSRSALKSISPLLRFQLSTSIRHTNRPTMIASVPIFQMVPHFRGSPRPHEKRRRLPQPISSPLCLWRKRFLNNPISGSPEVSWGPWSMHLKTTDTLGLNQGVASLPSVGGQGHCNQALPSSHLLAFSDRNWDSLVPTAVSPKAKGGALPPCVPPKSETMSHES